MSTSTKEESKATTIDEVDNSASATEDAIVAAVVQAINGTDDNEMFSQNLQGNRQEFDSTNVKINVQMEVEDCVSLFIYLHLVFLFRKQFCRM